MKSGLKLKASWTSEEAQGFLPSTCFARRPLVHWGAARWRAILQLAGHWEFLTMKWVVLEFHLRWHQPLMQLVSLNTFCLNKPCSWKWFQNSLFLVAVPLPLFLKMCSQRYHPCMSTADSKILFKLLHLWIVLNLDIIDWFLFSTLLI